ncbi:MAG TPA: hypothetical protein VF167_09525 [Longimicrobiaceae bacterium]
MTEFRIDVEADPVIDGLQAFRRQQPFAMSLALNNTTKDAQAAIQHGYEQRFTLRQPQFVKLEGAKITRFSTKSRLETELRVTERAGFLTKFETGEPKVPREGRAIAIPVQARRTKRDIIPKSQRPPALYASKRAQSGRIFSRRGLLLQKLGRGARATLRVLYVWKSRARTPAILHFVDTAHQAADRHWPGRALEAIDRAIATMRR